MAPSDASVTLALLSAPNSLDPQVTSANAVQIPATQIFEGLYAFDAQFSPQLMLADSVDVSNNAQTYTFKLRKVKFQNGADLTGKDVVASLQRAISLPGTPASQLKDVLSSMTAPDDSTVVMTFSHSVGTLPSILASYQSVILPASSVEGANSTPIAQDKWIGTGPYQVSSWEPGKSIVLTRYDGYQSLSTPTSGNSGAKQAVIKTLRFIPVSDAGARLSGIRTGQYQWADQMTPDLYDTLKSDAKVNVNLLQGGFTALYFNHMSGPTKDVRIRQAIQMALDLNQVALTQGPSATWKITPELPNSRVKFASTVGTESFNKQDIDGAKKLLAEAGYNGEQLRLISTAGSPTGKAMVVVAEELKAIGLNVKLDEMDLVTGQKLRTQESGWALAGGLEGGQVPDITQLPDVVCGNGMGGYCSDAMNSAISAFVEATTESAQQQAHDDVQKLYYQDVVSVKLVENYRIILTSKTLEGYRGESYPAFWNVSFTG